jgi:Uma2 family endonuclease
MVANLPQDYISPEQYLDSEAHSPIKHEYIDGQIYAMSGASDPHTAIAFNLIALLRPHLRSLGCRGYGSDMKTHIASKNIYYYADLIVTCDPRDRDSRYFKNYPKVIIEILSDSTEAFDRGKKFAHYRELASLEDYVLIAQDRQWVEVFRRNQAGRWELYSFESGDEVELASIGFCCPIEALYEDVTFVGTEE